MSIKRLAVCSTEDESKAKSHLLAWIEVTPSGNRLFWRQATVTRKNLESRALTMSRAGSVHSAPLGDFQQPGEFMSMFMYCDKCDKSYAVHIPEAIAFLDANRKALMCKPMPD